MHACLSHVQNGPDQECAGRAASHAEGQSCEFRTDALRLPPGRTGPSGGATHARGDADPNPQPKARDFEDAGRGGHPGGARAGVIVVDASALLEFLLQTPLGTRVEARLFRDHDDFHSPHLADVEVTQGLRRLVRARELSPDRAAGAVADLADLDLHRHAHVDLLARAWKLRENVTAYDAMYVA